MHFLDVYLQIHFLYSLVAELACHNIKHPLFLRNITLCSLDVILNRFVHLSTMRTGTGSRVTLDVICDITGLYQVSANRTRFCGLLFLSLEDPFALVNLVLSLNVSIESPGGGKLLRAVWTYDLLIMCQDMFVICLEVCEVAPALPAQRSPVLLKLVSLERSVPVGHKVTAITKLSRFFQLLLRKTDCRLRFLELDTNWI